MFPPSPFLFSARNFHRNHTVLGHVYAFLKDDLFIICQIEVMWIAFYSSHVFIGIWLKPIFCSTVGWKVDTHRFFPYSQCLEASPRVFCWVHMESLTLPIVLGSLIFQTDKVCGKSTISLMNCYLTFTGKISHCQNSM